MLIIITCLFVAENDALRKSLAANSKEHDMNIIPRPEKGIAGKGFNLQEAMGLADDDETYALLRVSSLSYSVHTYFQVFAHDCIRSALYGTWPLKQGSIVQCCGTANRKMLSAR